MFDAVVFDWDGTLADSREVVVASFQKALSGINCKIGDKFIEQCIGIGSAETFREILRFCKKSFDETLITNLVEIKIRNEIEMSSSIYLFDGALQLLQSLHGKIKIGLASMNDRLVIDHLLKIMNMKKFFNAVVTAADVAKSKPNPEIFLKCASKLNSKPEKCVVLEDSIFGVEAAKKAKMTCIAVLTGAYPIKMLEKANPDLIVNSLTQKTEIVRHIFG